MALLFMDGFDHYAMDDFTKKWTSASGQSADFNKVAGRWGGYAIEAVSFSLGDALIKGFTPGTEEVYSGVAFNSVVGGGSTTAPIRYIDSNGAVIMSIEINLDGSIEAFAGATSVASTAAGLVSSAVWHYLEAHYIPSLTSGTIEVRLDEVTVISATGVPTVPGTGLENVRGVSMVAGRQFWWDDVYVLDTTGTDAVSWLGDVRVVTTVPTADTAFADFTPSVGTDNYAMVDDDADIDDDTTYVENGSVGAKDLYTYPALGVTGTVYGVQLNVTAIKTDTNIRQFNHIVMPTTTITESTDAATLTSSYLDHTWILENNPDTGVAWTVSEIDAAAFGFKVVT